MKKNAATTVRLWASRGLWLKGNLHTHTASGDGALTPAQVAQEYSRHGYDFVFLTDHWRRTLPGADAPAKPLLIPAEEIDFPLHGCSLHVVCLGLRREWRRRKFRSVNELVRLATRERVLLIMAHPYWSGIASICFSRASRFLGVEVYNSLCDWKVGKGYSAVHWDEMLDAGRRLFGVAADDLHSLARGIAGGWVMVKARACTEPEILKALQSGDFYSTQGPELRRVELHRGRVVVACSPVNRINFISNRGFGGVVRARHGLLTEAAWPVRPESRYVRVECVDAQGKIAWSNPLFLP